MKNSNNQKNKKYNCLINRFIRMSFLMLFLVGTTIICAQEKLGNNVANSKIIHVNELKTELEIETNRGVLTLRPMMDNAIRVLFSESKKVDNQSFVFSKPYNIPNFKVKKLKDEVILSTSKISVTIDYKTSTLSFYDVHGNLILKEKQGGRICQATSIQGESTYAIEQTFLSPVNEYIYGTGQFQDGHLNVRDLPRRLTQVNTQISIPFIISSKGYGLLWHNYGLTDFNPAETPIKLEMVKNENKAEVIEVTSTEGAKKEERRDGEFVGRFSVDKSGKYAFLFDVGQVMARCYNVEIDGEKVIDFANRWLPPTTSWHTKLTKGEHTIKVIADVRDKPVVYFRTSNNETVFKSPTSEGIDYTIFAGNGDEVIGSYRNLTGEVPMMPVWALGYIHCRERFKTQDELLENAREFRKRKIPVDVITQDWQYWGKYGWNAMQFDEERYPSPKAMTDELHTMNMKLMLSVWSKVIPTSELGKELTAKDYYIPGTQWIDFFNPEARDFYWRSMSEKLLPIGIDAWWQDATEPENDAISGTKTFLGAGDKFRLIYPLFVTGTVYNGLRKDQPEKRPFIFTRCAYLGQQRYASATWSGDVGNDWETLRRQIPAGLNFVVTGQPYWTVDGGGFFRPDTRQYTDEAFHERFLRWFQFVTFCPLQRVHGFRTNTEFWRFGDLVEKESRRYLDLRYRLMPYIYSEVARVTFESSTIMRPLVMDFASDSMALAQNYEYMFGSNILVAPVIEPRVSKWNVYLPQHKEGWYNFWTGEILSGGQTVKSEASISTIPLHIKAGSILPLGQSKQYTKEMTDEVIELRIYRGKDVTFNFYEDEGTNNNYEKGIHSVIPITWNEEKQLLTIGKRKGKYPNMLKNRTFNIIIVRENHGIGIDSTKNPDCVIEYSGKEKTISF